MSGYGWILQKREVHRVPVSHAGDTSTDQREAAPRAARTGHLGPPGTRRQLPPTVRMPLGATPPGRPEPGAAHRGSELARPWAAGPVDSEGRFEILRVKTQDLDCIAPNKARRRKTNAT